MTNSTGGFWINDNDRSLATNGVSGSPHTMTYNYAGNAGIKLPPACDRSTWLTITQATPVLTLAARAITYGQTLADSSLSGSVATNAENNAHVAGGFAFQNDTIAPNGGSTNVSVSFTPAAAADYNNATNTISVTVTPPGKVTITSIVLLERNHVLITGTGSANATHIIQASPDLIH